MIILIWIIAAFAVYGFIAASTRGNNIEETSLLDMVGKCSGCGKEMTTGEFDTHICTPSNQPIMIRKKNEEPIYTYSLYLNDKNIEEKLNEML